MDLCTFFQFNTLKYGENFAIYHIKWKHCENMLCIEKKPFFCISHSYIVYFRKGRDDDSSESESDDDDDKDVKRRRRGKSSSR